jgi:hypothetical protein
VTVTEDFQATAAHRPEFTATMARHCRGNGNVVRQACILGGAEIELLGRGSDGLRVLPRCALQEAPNCGSSGAEIGSLWVCIIFLAESGRYTMMNRRIVLTARKIASPEREGIGVDWVGRGRVKDHG